MSVNRIGHMVMPRQLADRPGATAAASSPALAASTAPGACGGCTAASRVAAPCRPASRAATPAGTSIRVRRRSSALSENRNATISQPVAARIEA